MKMEDTIYEEENDTIFAISGVYMIVIGIAGGSLNILALIRAIRVSKFIESMRLDPQILAETTKIRT